MAPKPRPIYKARGGRGARFLNVTRNGDVFLYYNQTAGTRRFRGTCKSCGKRGHAEADSKCTDNKVIRGNCFRCGEHVQRAAHCPAPMPMKTQFTAPEPVQAEREVPCPSQRQEAEQLPEQDATQPVHEI